MSEAKYRIEFVAIMVGTSTQSINNWYRWKKQNPSHPLAAMLPDYAQEGARQMRLWHASDIDQLIQFKNLIPHGRNGILGDVTQKYIRNKASMSKLRTSSAGL